MSCSDPSSELVSFLTLSGRITRGQREIQPASVLRTSQPLLISRRPSTRMSKRAVYCSSPSSRDPRYCCRVVTAHRDRVTLTVRPISHQFKRDTRGHDYAQYLQQVNCDSTGLSSTGDFLQLCDQFFWQVVSPKYPPRGAIFDRCLENGVEQVVPFNGWL